MARTGTGNSVRIIGGKLRSRRVQFPDVSGLRPTGDRIRETLFNWLQSHIEGATCLDLFAGSGVLGFEALSRGAALVQFNDSNPRVIASLQENAARLQAEQAEILQCDSLRWMNQPPRPGVRYDIVFIDPPFSADLLIRSCSVLAGSGILASPAWIYLESSAPMETELLPQSWSLEKTKKAGAVYYALARSD